MIFLTNNKLKNQSPEITSKLRGNQKNQHACCFWFTGLSGSGKSTLAKHLEYSLFKDNKHCYILDGDLLRFGINDDLNFSENDRLENIRRTAHIAKLMCDSGLIIIVSLISPLRAGRRFARSLFNQDEFFEIYIDTPLEICEKRDPKGLYNKVRAGLINEFTGISSPYEKPLSPDLVISTHQNSISDCTNSILSFAKKHIISS